MSRSVEPNRSGQGVTHQWPWMVAVAVVLAVLVAVVWTRHEIQKARRIRDASAPVNPP